MIPCECCGKQTWLPRLCWDCDDIAYAERHPGYKPEPEREMDGWGETGEIDSAGNPVQGPR